MKKLSKILSVGLSLTLCAALVMPSFAANFTELQAAIDGTEDSTGEAVNINDIDRTQEQADGTVFTTESNETRYGYAWNADSQWFGIEAWEGTRNVLDDEGNETGETTETRHVQLNEDVGFNRETDNLSERMDKIVAQSVAIGGEHRDDVTIDLNDSAIDLNPGLTLTAASHFVDQSGTLIPTNVGGTVGKKYNSGHVITVAGGSTLTIQDNSLEKNGKITGAAGDAGGGAPAGNNVDNQGALILESGTISGSTRYAVNNDKGGSFTMTGGAISGNGNTGVYNAGSFTMTDGTISGYSSMGLDNKGSFTMTGGSVTGNRYCDVHSFSSSKADIRDGAEIGTVDMVVSQDSSMKLNSPVLTIDREIEIATSDSYFLGCKIDGDPCFVVMTEEQDENGKTIYTYTIRQVKGTAEDVTVEEGKRVELPVTVKSGDETVTPVSPKITSWESSDPDVAYIDDDGNLVCLKEGEAAIKATVEDATNRPWNRSYSFDVEFTVTVTAPAPEEPGDEDDSGTTGGTPTNPTNPTDSTDPTDPTNPTDPTDPTVDVDEPDVPLAEQPEAPDETVDVDEPDVPLAERPEAADETVEIDGPEVPLGDVPQTGEASTVLWLAGLLAAGMGLIYLNTGKRKENA